MPIKKIRDHQIIDHPAIPEKCLYVIGLHGKTDQHAPDSQPLQIIVKSVSDAAPLAPLFCLFACIK